MAALDYGLGKHFLYIGVPNMEKYIKVCPNRQRHHAHLLISTDVLLRECALHNELCSNQVITFNTVPTYIQSWDDALDMQKFDCNRWSVGLRIWVHGLVSLYVSPYNNAGWRSSFVGFPPQAYYDSLSYPDATCYGFGFVNADDFIALFESHTALNMVFDLTCFITPMVLFTKPNLRVKNIVAMLSIFILGGV
jgi:hypothetical protein